MPGSGTLIPGYAGRRPAQPRVEPSLAGSETPGLGTSVRRACAVRQWFGNRAGSGYSDTFFEAGWMDRAQARPPTPRDSASLRDSRLDTLPLRLGPVIASD